MDAAVFQMNFWVLDILKLNTDVRSVAIQKAKMNKENMGSNTTFSVFGGVTPGPPNLNIWRNETKRLPNTNTQWR